MILKLQKLTLRKVNNDKVCEILSIKRENYFKHIGF